MVGPDLLSTVGGFPIGTLQSRDLLPTVGRKLTVHGRIFASCRVNFAWERRLSIGLQEVIQLITFSNCGYRWAKVVLSLPISAEDGWVSATRDLLRKVGLTLPPAVGRTGKGI
ncbi:hypothetical protein M9H77_07090 [Catharanthus roseus]|uniref:Uncharacterized protein n=1 Tax=Catharanthus roseus TaxID=4058 RepID=A0ACC0BU44_CATRO|nr:hypothetical protein M9H77_07090 [Catharanthus roseus]